MRPAISKAEWRFLVGFDLETDPQVKKPLRLSDDWKLAPNQPGIYEIGLGSVDHMEAKYIGKAVQQSLKDRLHQHATNSSNKYVRMNAHRALFRCRPIDHETSIGKGKAVRKLLFENSDVLIGAIEGHFIVGFSDVYVWNGKNEWVQMASYDYDV